MKKYLLIVFLLANHLIVFTQIRVYSDSLYDFGGVATHRGKPFTGISITFFDSDDTSRIARKESYKDGLLSGLSIYYGFDSDGNYWVTDKKNYKIFFEYNQRVSWLDGLSEEFS